MLWGGLRAQSVGAESCWRAYRPGNQAWPFSTHEHGHAHTHIYAHCGSFRVWHQQGGMWRGGRRWGGREGGWLGSGGDVGRGVMMRSWGRSREEVGLEVKGGEMIRWEGEGEAASAPGSLVKVDKLEEYKPTQGWPQINNETFTGCRNNHEHEMWAPQQVRTAKYWDKKFPDNQACEACLRVFKEKTHVVSTLQL